MAAAMPVVRTRPRPRFSTVESASFPAVVLTREHRDRQLRANTHGPSCYPCPWTAPPRPSTAPAARARAGRALTAVGNASRVKGDAGRPAAPAVRRAVAVNRAALVAARRVAALLVHIRAARAVVGLARRADRRRARGGGAEPRAVAAATAHAAAVALIGVVVARDAGLVARPAVGDLRGAPPGVLRVVADVVVLRAGSLGALVGAV